MSMGPTPAQVATQVAMLRRQRPEASIYAIHTPGTWLGGSELRIDGECLPVAFCASALQISEALTSHDPAGSPHSRSGPLRDREWSGGLESAQRD